MRDEGYDRAEVDSYVSELQGEIVELRRALETATPAEGDHDSRLHDPEGAVTRTLAIAQETADRVLHDAQVDADRRRSEADEHATSVVAEADERAARLLSEMEAQAADVREQGVAAARSAIQVERDKAMAELAHVRRARDDLRTEAVDLKAALDRYRSQAREASDTLASAASGPLMSLDLPDFVDDDVVLAGIVDDADAGQSATELAMLDKPDVDNEPLDLTLIDVEDGDETDETADDPIEIESVEMDTPDEIVEDDVDIDLSVEEAATQDDRALAKVIAIDGASEDAEALGDEITESAGGMGGAFLAEVRAAAAEDDVALPAEDDETQGSDRFLSELRGITTEDSGDDLLGEVADNFFDLDDN